MKKNKEAKKKKKQINYNDLNGFERCEEKRNEGGERGVKNNGSEKVEERMIGARRLATCNSYAASRRP